MFANDKHSSLSSCRLLFLLLLVLVSLTFLVTPSAAQGGRPLNIFEKTAILEHPTFITISHSQTVSPLPPHNVTLTPHHFCATCHLMLQEFFRFVVSSLHQEEYQGQLEASALASLFCQGEPFSHWHPHHSAACQELILELNQGKLDTAGTNVTLETFLEPFLGQRSVKYYSEFPLRELLLFKRGMCQRVAQCPASPDPIGPAPTHKSSECEQCDRAVLVLAHIIGREVDIDAQGVAKAALRNWASELAFWYEKPAGVEGACIDLLEDPDWSKEVLRAVQREGKAMKAEGKTVEAVHQSLRHDVCIKMVSAQHTALPRHSLHAPAPSHSLFVLLVLYALLRLQRAHRS